MLFFKYHFHCKIHSVNGRHSISVLFYVGYDFYTLYDQVSLRESGLAEANRRVLKLYMLQVKVRYF